MPNDYENPKYTNKNEYHAGDGPFQFPWWAIVIAFVVWWPLGLVFIGLNAAMKNGRLGGFEQKAREATRDRTASGAKLVYNAEFRPIYDTPAQPQPKASAPHAAPQQAQVRAAGKKLKGAALATGLTVAGVLLLICALAALPDAIYWLPEALTEGGSYWTWLVEDSMPMLMSLTGGIGCLFGGWHIRTSRRMRRKIDKIVDAITQVSIQTNMLAVNGSIEAARAGEYGKGFVVVATDIRNLAHDSAENADRIKDLVKGIQDQIATVGRDLGEIATAALAEVDKTRSITANLSAMEGDVVEVEKGNVEAAESAQEIVSALSQVRVAVDQVSAAAQESEKAAEQASAAARQQSQGAEELSAAIEEIASLADELQSN